MFGIVVLALVLGVAVGAVAVASRRTRAVGGTLDDLIDPADVADLAARFDGIAAEHVGRQGTILESRLRPLVERRVPVRAMVCLPELHINRVRFADGTAVDVRGETPGDAGVLASVVLRHAVLPRTCCTDARGTHLVFDWSGGRRRLSMLVTAVDHPD